MRYFHLAPLTGLALFACEKADPAVGASGSFRQHNSGSGSGPLGLIPADCTSTRGVDKVMVTIDATSLKFCESLATLGTIKDARPGLGDIELDVENGSPTLIRKQT